MKRLCAILLSILILGQATVLAETSQEYVWELANEYLPKVLDTEKFVVHELGTTNSTFNDLKFIINLQEHYQRVIACVGEKALFVQCPGEEGYNAQINALCKLVLLFKEIEDKLPDDYTLMIRVCLGDGNSDASYVDITEPLAIP